jgi:organic hydroperoxide reductase OsmC/OhrA
MQSEHHYEVSLAVDGRRGLLNAPGRPQITGGAPADFGGSDDVWSPEHLFLAAINLCLLTTFHALAAKKSFASLEYRDRIEGKIDKTEAGLRFNFIKHHVELKVPADEVERARQLLERARKHCIVANALSLPVEMEAVVLGVAA